MTQSNGAPSPLKLAREKARLTQVGLAKVLGVHPASISLAERGALSRQMARRCAEALGVPVEQLLPANDAGGRP